MRKNPYLAQAESIKLDKRSQDIIKKARTYGIVVYDNIALGKSLLDPNSQSSPTCKDMLEVFSWCINREKDTQMSGS